MADEKDAKATQPVQAETKEIPDRAYPPIMPQFWLDGEVQRIFTTETDNMIPEGKLVVEFYATLRQYGIKIYMTKESAVELGKELQRVGSE